MHRVIKIRLNNYPFRQHYSFSNAQLLKNGLRNVYNDNKGLAENTSTFNRIHKLYIPGTDIM